MKISVVTVFLTILDINNGFLTTIFVSDSNELEGEFDANNLNEWLMDL